MEERIHCFLSDLFFMKHKKEVGRGEDLGRSLGRYLSLRLILVILLIYCRGD